MQIEQTTHTQQKNTPSGLTNVLLKKVVWALD